ncbi:hypothetical protein ACFE04_001801 [Oxalis oulophora]
MAGNNIIVVFDFDKTIIDVDSDNWMIDELGFTDMFNHAPSSYHALEFRYGQDDGEIHAQGKTIQDISAVLKRIPIHPRVVSAIKEARALGCELRILSDANTFFIQVILEHLGLRECFSEINTNPGFVDGEGRLNISPYVDFTNCPHGCPNPCPPNMCKGVILERIQASLGAEKIMIYLGDGLGDYCSSLRLKEKDYLMTRKDFPVWTLICDNMMLIKAKIQEWADGADLQKVLLEIINKIVSREKHVAELLSRDYKLEAISMPAQENSIQVLSVTQ